MQAHAACSALANIDGILLASCFSDHCIHVIYSLDDLSFEIIVELLNELEFETDSSLLISLRNTIFCYLEDNARDNMHIDVADFEAFMDTAESKLFLIGSSHISFRRRPDGNPTRRSSEQK